MIQLATHSISERVKDRVKPVLQEKQHTVLFAPGGSGMSWLALCWAPLVSSGRVDTYFLCSGTWQRFIPGL